LGCNGCSARLSVVGSAEVIGHGLERDDRIDVPYPYPSLYLGGDGSVVQYGPDPASRQEIDYLLGPLRGHGNNEGNDASKEDQKPQEDGYSCRLRILKTFFMFLRLAIPPSRARISEHGQAIGYIYLTTPIILGHQAFLLKHH